MKTYDLTKWKDVEEYCSDILSKGGTKSFSEVKEFQKNLSELQIHPTKRRTLAKVEEASKFVNQLLKDKTPWYRKPENLLAIGTFILGCVFTWSITYYPEQSNKDIHKPLQSSEKQPDSSKPPINTQNPTLNKSSNADGGKAAAGS